MGIGAMIREVRCGELWPSFPIGAFLPAPEFGSGPVDDEIGGGGFEGSGLTPLERVLTESRPGRASLNSIAEG